MVGKEVTHEGSSLHFDPPPRPGVVGQNPEGKGVFPFSSGRFPAAGEALVVSLAAGGPLRGAF